MRLIGAFVQCWCALRRDDVPWGAKCVHVHVLCPRPWKEYGLGLMSVGAAMDAFLVAVCFRLAGYFSILQRVVVLNSHSTMPR
jgi:hypothetical protein